MFESLWVPLAEVGNGFSGIIQDRKESQIAGTTTSSTNDWVVEKSPTGHHRSLSPHQQIQFPSSSSRLFLFNHFFVIFIFIVSLPSTSLLRLLANSLLAFAIMGYSDLDQLAINTIRVLAVSAPPLAPRRRCTGASDAIGETVHSQLLRKLATRPYIYHKMDVTNATRRLMPPARPTRATPVPPWAWPLWPTFCSTSS